MNTHRLPCKSTLTRVLQNINGSTSSSRLKLKSITLNAQELAQLRQEKADQGNNDALEATDVTSTTTGDSNTPDDAKANDSCGVIDMSSNNWFPEYSSNIYCNDERMRSLQLENQQLLQENVELGVPSIVHTPGESKFIQSILSTWEGVRKRVNDTSSSGMEVTEPAVTVSSDAASVRATLDAFLNALQQTTDWPFEGQADLLNYGALLDAFHVVLGELTHTDGGANASLLLADEGKNTTAAPPSSSTQRFAWGVSDRERLAYQVLRVTAILLENSINKHKFPSLDHVTSLIASTSDRVSLEAVKVVAMLSLPPHSHRHPIDTQNQSDAMLTGSS
ncbi:hypothetical protein DYB28_002208, partial [Aphanomyces astaci]